jgi:uroporphyrinogen decarboxylase
MNHWQRIEAAMRGDPTDHPPLTMWRHFPDEDQHVDKLVARTLKWQNRWQFDLIKFMPCNSYGVADWRGGTASRAHSRPSAHVRLPIARRRCIS